MTREFVYSVCSRVFTQPPMQINRFSTGLDNYVYHVTFSDADYVFAVANIRMKTHFTT